MTDVADIAPRSKWKKVLLQALAGAVCGFFGMLGGLWLMDRATDGLPPPTMAFGFGVALIYLLLAIVLGLGTLSPRFGEKALNVEDAQEIVEERPSLVGAALFCLLAGGLVLALTLAPAPMGAEIITADTAMILAAACAIGLIVTAYAYRNHGDELMRQMNEEAQSLTMALTLLLFGGWAALAQLGQTDMFSPLLFISGLFAFQLLAIIVVVGRRGMLKPR